MAKKKAKKKTKARKQCFENQWGSRQCQCRWGKGSAKGGRWRKKC